MPTKKLVKVPPPRSFSETAKVILDVLKTEVWEFPKDGKYNGSGGPGFKKEISFSKRR